MILVLIALFFGLSASPSFATLRICKYSALSTPDWIELCNDQTAPQSTLGYSLHDSTSSNKKELSCLLPANTSASFTFSEWLNNSGDLIILKKDGSPVDQLTYCNDNCPADSANINIANSSCAYLDTDGIWKTSTDSTQCTPAPSSNCQPLPSPTPLPTLTLSVTQTPTPTPIPSATPTPTSSATPTPTSSFPQIFINRLPATGFSNYAYELEFSATRLQSDSEYLVKPYGGVNDNYSIETKSSDRWLNFNSSWNDFPKFKANSSGEISGKITFRPKEGREVGTYRVQVRLRHASNQSDNDSPLVYMIINPAPTITPTPIFSPTISPTPTEDLIATPMLQVEDTPTLTPPLQPEVQGVVDVVKLNPTPTPALTLSSKVNLPVIIMIAGGLLLLTPVILVKSGYVN